jgi:antitoxin MazE
MITQVRKWGNSLGVRIPKALAEDARVADGMDVELTVEKDRLVIKPVADAKYDLTALIAGITPRNRHGETLAKRRGKEVW